MSAQTSIEWTDVSWNPVRGCSMAHGSENLGCLNCYAARLAARGFDWAKGLARMTASGPRWTGKVGLVPELLVEPLRWRKPKKVFVNSMSDLFHESLPFEHIAAVYGMMAAASHHTFQVLTKRPQRRLDFHTWLRSDDTPPIARCAYHAGRWRAGRPLSPAVRFAFPDNKVWPLPNVWEGVSVENQELADQRIPLLGLAPAAIRFISLEPQLADVSVARWLRNAWACNKCGQVGYAPSSDRAPRGHEHDGCNYRAVVSPGLDWVIVGGESGPGARRFRVGWARSVVRQCRAARVPVFVKQLGANVIDRNDAGFDGSDPSSWPDEFDWSDRVEHDLDGTRDDYQGAPVRVHLKSRKGGDMKEWPRDLRVRQFPKGAA